MIAVTNYNKVIDGGDDHSEVARKSVEKANKDTSLTQAGVVLEGIIKTGRNFEGVLTSIDGVGTKVQIYTNRFEQLVEGYEKNIKQRSKGKSGILDVLSNDDFINTIVKPLKSQATELWIRMFHDLIAMNVDDLRDGEMAAIFTNIVDINHLEGMRGDIFSETFSLALAEVIEDVDINAGNGETAWLGEVQKFSRSLEDFTRMGKEEITAIKGRRKLRDSHRGRQKNFQDISEELKESIIILNKQLEKKGALDEKEIIAIDKLEEQIDKLDDEVLKINIDINKGTEDIKNSLERIRIQKNILEQRIKELEFNIGGTGEGLVLKEKKLVKMNPGQRIIYFSERPTDKGIIGARSNGYTRIRELMHSFAGEGWESLLFEEFLEKIGSEKASKISSELKEELSGKNLEMWDIATGKTTVFNPFVSRKLLGGDKDIADEAAYSRKSTVGKFMHSLKEKIKNTLIPKESSAIARISALIHITGNPLHKIASGIKDDRFAANIDMSGVKIPQILEVLQSIGDFTDEDFMGSFNMGTPYAIVCEEEDVEKIIEEAKKEGLIATDIGEVVEKDLKKYDRKLEITGVGIHNSTVEKIEEIDRDMPELPKRYNNSHSGKVRETYDHPENDDEMILVATDRISTHDVVHQSLVEGKGAVLTQMSNFWFDILKNDPATKDILTHMVESPVWPNDFPEGLKEKSVIVKKVTALPVEAIVRDILMGSVAKEYDSETGKLGTGQFVQKGMKKFEIFDEPQFTPSTKGEKDTNIAFDVMYKQLEEIVEMNPQWNKTAKGLANEIREKSLQIFTVAKKEALSRGYMVGDTKFEFGMDKDGNLILIDEVLTQDSSRYIKTENFVEGEEPSFHDKQFARNKAEREWRDKPRTDSKKYPLHFSDETTEKTQILYKEMNIAFS